MADPFAGSSSFWTQANALLRKNLTYQVSLSFSLCLCVSVCIRIWKEMIDEWEFWVVIICFVLFLIIFWLFWIVGFL